MPELATAALPALASLGFETQGETSLYVMYCVRKFVQAQPLFFCFRDKN